MNRPSVRSLLLGVGLLVGAVLPGCSTPRLAYAPAGSGVLAGGATDDNARLPEYLAYVEAYPHADVPKLDLRDRRIVTLRDAWGRRLWDVGVRIPTPHGEFRARSNAAGRVPVPCAALGIAGDREIPIAVEGSPGWDRLPPGCDVVHVPDARRRAAGARMPVDVAFVVDTTGSMSDEVERLRRTLVSVVRQLDAHPCRPVVRIGGVVYRDDGDEYVTRRFAFTRDMAEVQHTLDRVVTGGGGDEPEAVQQALSEAVRSLAWGPAGTLRVLFLVGDAPPHFDRGVPYTRTMREALECGITIFPVACSGMNDTGEFVWRQLAAVTLGRFLYVSYGGTTEHHVGGYMENDLDRLMRDAVWSQLDALSDGRGCAREEALRGPERFTPCPPPSRSACGAGRPGWGRSPWDFGIPGWTR